MKKLHILLVMFFTIAFSSFATAQDAKDETIATTTSQSSNLIKLKVSGLTCGGDIKDIEKQVKELKGVISCVPARRPSATTLFEVKYDPAVVSEKEIRNAVEGT